MFLAGEDAAMRTRYRVDGETIRFENRDGRGSVLLELSRAGDAGLIVRGSRARVLRAGPGRASSSSSAASGPDLIGTAEAAASAIRRYRLKLSD